MTTTTTDTAGDDDAPDDAPDDADATGETGTEGTGATGRVSRRFLLTLGVPALGMALAVTVISSYLPVLVEQASGPVVVGALIGGEGFFGIFMPGLVGGWSDRHSRRVRDRAVLLAVFGGVVVLGMAAIGVIAASGSHSLLGYALALVFLYAGYYAFLAPYWSLYPDLVPDEQSGRSRSAESVWRVTGVGLALIGGGLLLGVWSALPFLAAAVVVATTVTVLLWKLRSRFDRPVEQGNTPEDTDDTGDTEDTGGTGGTGSWRAIRDLLRDRHIRLLCAANSLWNFALASLRAFVVLFFTVGMDRSSSFVATVIFPLVAVGIAIAAPVAGWAADRWGHVRLLLAALVVYGVGMAVPGITQQQWVIAMIPVVALGAATVMTLPFSVLMRLLPEEHHGSASGLFGLSRGVGATLGPLVTGGLVLTLSPVLSSTQGYAAMWLVSSLALLASIPLLWALRSDDRL